MMVTILCITVGLLQRLAAFAISATVSVTVQNMGGKFSIPYGGLEVLLITPSNLPLMEKLSSSWEHS